MSEILFKREQTIDLIWDRPAAFDYPDMVKINATTGPNSFFHAVLQAYNNIYHTEHYKGCLLERDTLIGNIRKDIAKRLSTDNNLPLLQRILSPILHYNPQLSVDIICEQLKDIDHPFSVSWIGLIMYYMNLDIYILDEETWNVYIYNEEEERNYIHSGNRDVVVLLYDHYVFSTVGLIVDDEDNIATLFTPQHNFITTIRCRLHDQRKLNNKEINAERQIAPTVPVIPFNERANIVVSNGVNVST